MEPRKPSSGMLLIADSQNLYHSARGLYGRGSRIDFLRLRDRIAGDRTFNMIYSIAYIPELRAEAPSLASALKRLGYEILLRSPECFEAQVNELTRLFERYTTLAVASGSGDFLYLYRAAKEKGLSVEAYSFVDAANTDVIASVDKFEHLGAEVLRGNYPTVERLHAG